MLKQTTFLVSLAYEVDRKLMINTKSEINIKSEQIIVINAEFDRGHCSNKRRGHLLEVLYGIYELAHGLKSIARHHVGLYANISLMFYWLSNTLHYTA